jgi:hypothetical protein
MLYRQVFIAITTGFGLLGTTSATPTPSPSELAPRACTTIEPSFISNIDKAAPDTTVLDGFGSLWNNDSLTRVTLLRFDPPTGATGCNLIYLWNTTTAYAAGSDSEVSTGDVFSLDSVVGPENTWNNQPEVDTKIAQVQFPAYFTPTKLQGVPPIQYLASNTCSAGMSFEVAVASWVTKTGVISWYNEPDIGKQ